MLRSQLIRHIGFVGAVLLTSVMPFVMPLKVAAQEITDVKPSAPLVLEGQRTFYISRSTHNIDSAIAGASGWGDPLRIGAKLIFSVRVPSGCAVQHARASFPTFRNGGIQIGKIPNSLCTVGSACDRHGAGGLAA